MHFAKKVAAAVGSSLKLKLVLLIVTILALTIGIAPWSAIKMQERQLLQASEEHLRAFHEMLQKTIVATCKLTGNADSVQQVIEAVTNHRDIDGVRMFDAGGVIRYSSRPAERGTRLSTAEMSRFYGQVHPVIRTSREGKVTYALVQPMLNQPACVSCHASKQKVLGILQVSLALGPTWRQLADLKRSALIATVITLAVIVVGVWLSLTLLVDQPLQQLVGVMRSAERGDLSARVETRQRDELGQLSRHFNEMISKLAAAQREVERYHREQLARADRLATIGELAAAIAHEIRNPLTGISGALSVLGRDFPADDPRRDVIRQTHLLIERLNKSVENILHYSRPSEPQFQTVNLDDIFGQTLSLVESEAKKARVHLVRHPQPASGGEGNLGAVRADPHQIQQVLMNVILNAIQATAAGGQVQLRTGVWGAAGGQPYAYVEVRDSGIGMTPAQTAKAFHPFFSTKVQGTGLGLAIAKQLIEQHGGRITLHSTPGEGTVVKVELPGCLPLDQCERRQ
ncbi:MAG: PAS domain-containing sensor histidine kinase [Candidatus Binatia bacterium]